MDIVIAADSFKGSATTFEVSNFIEKGVKRLEPLSNINKFPLADGGEGTVDALVSSLNGKYIEKEVIGPLGQRITAKFGLINDDIAVIAMAEASGLTLIKEQDRNPFKTTTFGTGELMKTALDYGVHEILIGIGGSATNDAGVGMAQALGVSFQNKNGKEIGFGAERLKDIASIDTSSMDKRIRDTKIKVFSDVTNPLCGENGASYVYGPQKGALKEEVILLDQILSIYGNKLENQLDINIVNEKGAGAAGGMGSALLAFCNAEIHSGVDEVLDIIGIERFIKSADLVITGEGEMNFQSLNGKAPIGVARIAEKYKVPVIAIVGSEGEKICKVYDHGISLVIDIVSRPMSLSDAMENVAELIEDAGEKVIRAFRLKDKSLKTKEGMI